MCGSSLKLMDSCGFSPIPFPCFLDLPVDDGFLFLGGDFRGEFGVKHAEPECREDGID